MRAVLVLLLPLLLTACANDTPEGTVAPVSSTPQAVTDTTAADLSHASVGQALYVPAYSHIYTGDRMRVVDLTATLSVRNTDSRRSIQVERIRYAGTDGSILYSYLDSPRRLGPLASTEVVVNERDREGGVGASFLVEWTASESVSPPVVEAVMISTAGQQGISFLTTGRVTESVGL